VEEPAPDALAFVVSKSRLEFLCDGIFAIAMTILVLELKVPELADRHSVAELAQALAHHGSTFFSYLLSFLVLGVMWYRQNEHYRHLRHITRAMLALHLAQLAAAAFFPFCAALFGRYPTNNLSMALYTGCVAVYTLASTAGWLVAERAGSISTQLSPVDRKRYRKRHLRRCAVVTCLFLFCLARALGS
jgi:uncharacterized membrane protein